MKRQKEIEHEIMMAQINNMEEQLISLKEKAMDLWQEIVNERYSKKQELKRK